MAEWDIWISIKTFKKLGKDSGSVQEELSLDQDENLIESPVIVENENLEAENVEKSNADVVEFSEDLSENVDHEEGTSAEEPSVGYLITIINFSNTFSRKILVNVYRRPYL